MDDDNDVVEGFVEVRISARIMSRIQRLGPQAVLVYVYLCGRIDIKLFWDTNGTRTTNYVSLEEIAKHTGLGNTNVLKALDKLEVTGCIWIGRNKNATHQYTIIPDKE